MWEKSNTKLCNKLNEGILKVKKDPRYKELLQKYFSQ